MSPISKPVLLCVAALSSAFASGGARSSPAAIAQLSRTVVTADKDGLSWTVALELTPVARDDHAPFSASATVSPGWLATPLESHQNLSRDSDGTIPALHFRLTPAEAKRPSEGAYVDLLVHLSTGSPWTRSSIRISLKTVNGSLTTVSPDTLMKDIVRATVDGNPVLSGAGTILRDDPSRLPEDITGVPLADRQSLSRLLDAKLAESRGSVSAGLTIDNSSQAPEQPPVSSQAGCGVGDTSHVAIFAILFLISSIWRGVRIRHRLTIALIIPASLLATPRVVRAESRCLWGFSAFWDGRQTEAGQPLPWYNPNNYPGWRIQACNSAILSCFPSDPGCCFSFLQYTKVQLQREINGVTQGIVDTWQSLDSAGGFVLCDGAWNASYTYSLVYTFDHPASPPGYFNLAPESGLGSWSTPVYFGPITEPDTQYAGVVSLNHARDFTPFAYALAATWQTLVETMDALTAQQETRYRKNFGSANAFDKIKVKIWPTNNNTNDSACDTSTLRLESDGGAAEHELMHIVNGRVVGCSGGLPAFPKLGPFTEPNAAHDPWRSGEGSALLEAIGDLGGHVWAFDPATAMTADVVQHSALCTNISFENDLVSEYNNANGLYDLIDTQGDFADNGKSDTVHVTVKQLFDAMVAWKGTPGAGNRQADEFAFVSTGNWCAPIAYQCATGQVCGADNLCYRGTTTNPASVHGCNLRDWVYYLPNGTWSSVYADALISSTCIGTPVDIAPFTGGFRNQ